MDVVSLHCKGGGGCRLMVWDSKLGCKCDSVGLAHLYLQSLLQKFSNISKMLEVSDLTIKNSLTSVCALSNFT